MSYDYKIQKKEIFTEDGVNMFIEIRDKAFELIKKAGCVRMDKLFASGDAWTSLACVDRMIELGELREIPQKNCAGQHRIFISAN